ncbi:MAG: FGGY-family carbohydrate kinase, partial [Isosphaeraceae bacterium]
MDAATHGLAVARIFIGGGGARSALWLQVHADVLKQPVHLTRESESCALGSAMTAAVAAGAYRDFDEAARAMVAIEKTVAPNLANAGVYDELFGHYVE